MSDWFYKFNDKMQKIAIDKLTSEQMAPQLPEVNWEDQQAGQEVGSSGEVIPAVRNNKYNVRCDNTEFTVELIPSIVSADNEVVPEQSADVSNQGQEAQVGSDTTATNPEANPELLNEWLKNSNPPEKEYSHQESGTIDPLSREEEGLEPIQVHKKAELDKLAESSNGSGSGLTGVPIREGIDRSNPKPPCKYCSNYIAKDGLCAQGLDVEKVQTAGSCSWLNAEYHPFMDEVDKTDGGGEIVNSDISSVEGGHGDGEYRSTDQVNTRNAMNVLNEYLKDLFGE